MHNAPAVSYCVGRSRTYGALVIGVAGLGALTLAAWSLQADVPNSRHLLGWLAWLLSAAWALASWWHAPQGTLRYDQAQWIWTPLGCAAPLAVTVTVQTDLQRELLVRLQTAPSRTLWLWLEQRRAPGRWGDLRRALFASRRDAGVSRLPGSAA